MAKRGEKDNLFDREMRQLVDYIDQETYERLCKRFKKILFLDRKIEGHRFVMQGDWLENDSYWDSLNNLILDSNIHYQSAVDFKNEYDKLIQDEHR